MLVFFWKVLLLVNIVKLVLAFVVVCRFVLDDDDDDDDDDDEKHPKRADEDDDDDEEGTEEELIVALMLSGIISPLYSRPIFSLLCKVFVIKWIRWDGNMTSSEQKKRLFVSKNNKKGRILLFKKVDREIVSSIENG